MSKQDAGKTLLENAYRLQSPDDNIRYYGALAEHYDEDFADGLGYALPAEVATQYKKLASYDDAPAIDIGCGTGLIADALSDMIANEDLIIDGVDISDAMLQIAKEKQRYRHLYQADLSSDSHGLLKNYSAILSSGTFTHGHLGPDALLRLLDIARGCALFVLTINKAHFASHGFQESIGTLKVKNRIQSVKVEELDIYLNERHEHSGDKALLLTFRKT